MITCAIAALLKMARRSLNNSDADCSDKAKEQQPSDHCNENLQNPRSDHHAVASSYRAAWA
jgi:hypothetical protein